MRVLLRRVVDLTVWTGLLALVGLVFVLLSAQSCVPNAPPPDYEKKMERYKSGPSVPQFIIQQGGVIEESLDIQ